MARTRDIALAVILAGVIAGTVDIGAAALINAKGPDFIARVIAGGLFGKGAIQGGLAMTCAGVLTQWGLSVIIAAIYVLASLRMPALRRWWWAAGTLFGAPVFAVMEFVVLPLSALHAHPKFTGVMAKDMPLIENLVAMAVFGLIVAGIARWRLGPAKI
jgi:uncharacterized membrane protein YagU involved in acid resistance